MFFTHTYHYLQQLVVIAGNSCCYVTHLDQLGQAVWQLATYGEFSILKKSQAICYHQSWHTVSTR